MIIAIDIETAGLDARKFIMASIVREDGCKKIFYDKKELWDYVLKLGYAEYKRKRKLTVYSHNAQFDFYGYADLKDENIVYFNLSPFIAGYKINGVEAIKFLDTMGIFSRMSLKKVGEIIGLEKLEMPIEFKEDEKIPIEKLKEFEPYVIRDSEILIKGIKDIKEKLKEEEINLKRIYTISQIAIAYFINKLKKMEEYKDLFAERRFGRLFKTKLFHQIHSAYRGGRVECFKTGKYENINYVDCNNLYGTASINISFPDLKSERLINNPLELFDVEELINKIGISKVLIHNRKDETGLLAVRMGETGNYYPKKDKYILGVYTHLELQEALKEGYKILGIEWSVIWDEHKNPFKVITPKIYKLRKESKTEFDNWFYKEMQNRCYGKMGQRKEGYEIITDSVEKAQEYLTKQYEIMRGIGYNYQYQRTKNEHLKTYYAPIIPTLINAWGRVNMFRYIKKIPKEDLIYMDTDSCLFKGKHFNKFPISDKLGEFKIEYENVEGYFIGRKTYLIGDMIKISGFRKKDVSKKDFIKGQIKSKKMISMKSNKKLEEVGGFEEEERDLKRELENYENMMKVLDEQKVYIDSDIKNINYFKEQLDSISNTLK